MNIRFPLYAKILFWFFLNLILLGAVMYGFFRFQFRVGLDSLLAGQAGNRMEAISTVMEAELRKTPRAEWDALLERFNGAYEGVEFFLLRPNGVQVAGSPVQIPADVRNRLLGGRFTMGAPMAVFETRPWPRRPDSLMETGQEYGLQRQGRPKFMVRTEHPVRYWVGIRLAIGKRIFTLPAGDSAVLLAVSNTLSGGGLFFDLGPWMKVGFGALALSILFWLPLVRSITRSISQMTGAAAQIAEGNFKIRVNAKRRDELGRLGLAINAMSERLAGFVDGQKRFLGDAAHELCSPLARIELALSILEACADDTLQPRIADVREESREMAGLVNGILAFSKASFSDGGIRLEPVGLAELVRRVVAREAAMGDAMVQMEIAEDLHVQAEPVLLARALANLVRNAVRYAGYADPIAVRAEAQGDRVLLTVTDTGPGVPEEALSQLFNPFFRLDSSRSRDTGGFGLGLAIVQTCVQACGGSVVARNHSPSGLQVEITLDRIPAPPSAALPLN